MDKTWYEHTLGHSFKSNFHLKSNSNYDVVIVAVAHQQFKSFTCEDWSRITKKDGIIYDVKSLVPIKMKPMRL